MSLRALVAIALTVSVTGCVNAAVDDETTESTDELTGDAGRAVWTRKVSRAAAADVATDDYGNAYLATSQRLAKYDAYGTLEWSRTLGLSEMYAVSVATRGDTVIVAYDGGGDPFGCGIGNPSNSLTIARLSPTTGVCRSSARYLDFPRDNYRFLELEIDGSGNLYLARHFFNEAGGRDLIVRKLTASGTVAWTRTVRDPLRPTTNQSSEKWLHDMAVSAAGEVYLTGWFGGTVDFGSGPIAANPPPSSTTWTADDEGTGYLVKLSTSGAPQRVETFGNAAVGYAVAIGPDGRVAVGGRFKGTVAFGSLSRSNPTPSRDTFVVSFDPSLEAQWVRRWYGTASQELRGLGFDSAGYLNATGSFWSSDPTPDDLNIGSYELTTTHGEGRKMFVARISPAGSTIWAKTYLTEPPAEPHPDGGGIWVQPTAIAITPNNRRILVAGQWWGAHPALGHEENYTFLTRILPF